MNEHETQLYSTVETGIAEGWRWAFLGHRNAIRAYSNYGVTIMTIDLDNVSEDAQLAYFDLLTPYL